MREEYAALMTGVGFGGIRWVVSLTGEGEEGDLVVIVGRKGFDRWPQALAPPVEFGMRKTK